MIYKINTALLLYIMASVITLIGHVFKYETIITLFKPIIVPAIYFYYLQYVNYKPKFWFSFAVFLSFISDMLVLFQFTNDEVPIAILNLSMYIILLFYYLRLAETIKFRGLKIFYFCISAIAIFLIAYMLLSIMSNITLNKFIMYIVYGCVLSLLTSIAIFNYLNSSSNTSLYGLLLCFCYIFTDSFFVLYNFYIKLDILFLINLGAQFISYYYMVNFIVSKDQKDESK